MIVSVAAADPVLVQLATHLAKTGESVKSGPIGLGVVLLLCIACYFLFKSMSRHMKKVREDFPSGKPDKPADSSDPPAPGESPPATL